jgi:hypothetical protein
MGRNSGGNHGDNGCVLGKILEKPIKIINIRAGIVGAGCNTLAASDAQIVVEFHGVPASVIAVFYRTGTDTGVAIGTFFFIN